MRLPVVIASIALWALSPVSSAPLPEVNHESLTIRSEAAALMSSKDSFQAGEIGVGRLNGYDFDANDLDASSFGGEELNADELDIFDIDAIDPQELGTDVNEVTSDKLDVDELATEDLATNELASDELDATNVAAQEIVPKLVPRLVRRSRTNKNPARGVAAKKNAQKRATASKKAGTQRAAKKVGATVQTSTAKRKATAAAQSFANKHVANVAKKSRLEKLQKTAKGVARAGGLLNKKESTAQKVGRIANAASSALGTVGSVAAPIGLLAPIAAVGASIAGVASAGASLIGSAANKLHRVKVRKEIRSRGGTPEADKTPFLKRVLTRERVTKGLDNAVKVLGVAGSSVAAQVARIGTGIASAGAKAYSAISKKRAAGEIASGFAGAAADATKAVVGESQTGNIVKAASDAYGAAANIYDHHKKGRFSQATNWIKSKFGK